MKNFKIKVGTQEKTYPSGTTYQEIVKDFQKQYEYEIVLVLENGKPQELQKELLDNVTLSFITIRDNLGYKAYRRSLCFLLVKAIYDVCGKEDIERVRLLYAVGTGYYCEISGNVTVDQNLLNQVKERMNRLVEKKIPIGKHVLHTDEAIRRFKEYGMKDKEKLFKYRRVSKVNVYRLNEFEDYYYGHMVPNTSCLKCFDLRLQDKGFVIQMPSRQNPMVIPKYYVREKLFQVQKESIQWGDLQGIDTVGSLNDRIAQGNVADLILVQEALQEKKISQIANQILEKGEVKFVLIAGPSSSGKTTFSHRLSVQLRVNGLVPHPIGIDNYYVNRDEIPLDEEGKPDFEGIEAIDIESFNRDLTDLLNGKRIEIPRFNFKLGRREYHGDFLQLGENDVLIIEGIHGLNGLLSKELPAENKFKIYISALTQLNIDEHNRIPTTDGRLLRRIVRDARTRGTSGKETIAMWASVRRGEEKNIFPFQEDADVMFNSALIYELSVLKQFVEPILFGIKKEDEEYLEAKRLLKFLDYFIGIPTDFIPKNSLLREFIGGGCFQI